MLLLRTPAAPLLNAVVWRLGMVDSRVRDGVPSPPDDVHAVAITMEMLAPRQARAYCGPAHHRHWAVPPDIDPPEIVELPTPAGIARYHLVHHPSTGRPARDYYGNLLYIPIPEASEPVF